MRDSFGVSVVIPVYNGADVLTETIRRLSVFLAAEFAAYEIILIDDCSTDQSQMIIQAAATRDARIRFQANKTNKGQQKTLAEGFLLAKLDIVLSIDADLPCTMADLKKIAEIANGGIEIVFGKRTGDIQRKWWRRLGSWLANGLFRAIFPYEIRDFGCGIAALRRSLVEKLRSQKKPIRLIKLDLLNIAESYVETGIQSSPRERAVKSTYSFRKLLKLFWIMLTYRFQ